jgi:hypothetical protein
MIYEKQNFEDGQVLEAEHLNKMEEELARPKSWNELMDRPFGDKETVIMEEQELVYDAENGGLGGFVSAPIGTGETLRVVFDGVAYECLVAYNYDIMALVFGNLAMLGNPEDTGEPFLGAYMGDGAVLLLAADEASHNVKISVLGAQKLDNKYYNGSSVFYCDRTYLFVDAALTTKATKSDVKKAIAVGTIAVRDPANSSMMTPCNINAATYDYAVVACMEWNNSATLKTTILYTAEYTPPTT